MIRPGPHRHASKRPAAAKPRRRPRDTGPSKACRLGCAERDRYRCVRCGAPATNLQHRRGRGMGGTRSEARNAAGNLLSLCGSGTTGCHGHVESHREEAVADGYAVRRSDSRDPATIPVRTAFGWEVFTDDFQRTPCEPPEDPQ